MAALGTLLDGLIDYAGLFPPARLSMVETVRNYAGYAAGPHAGALGRLVVPLAQLDEFGETLTGAGAAAGDWHLSVLGSGEPAGDLARLRRFNHRPDTPRIVSLEMKAAGGDIAQLDGLLPPSLEVWIEVPISPSPDTLLAEIRRLGRGAKFRTGGVTADAFPTAAAVARFLQACHRTGVPAKATAGLHHPVTGTYPLTYAPDSPTGRMFGFLNLFLAAALTRQGAPLEQVIRLLEDDEPAHFHCEPDALRWREARFAPPELAATRQRLLRSFGSCSFTEPLQGLHALGWNDTPD